MPDVCMFDFFNVFIENPIVLWYTCGGEWYDYEQNIFSIWRW